MNKGLKIILGLILLVVPLYLILPGMPLSEWGDAAWKIIQGGLTIAVLGAGIILIILGISEIKN